DPDGSRWADDWGYKRSPRRSRRKREDHSIQDKTNSRLLRAFFSCFAVKLVAAVLLEPGSERWLAGWLHGDAQLVEREGAGVGDLLDLLVERGAESVARGRAGAQQHRPLRGAGGLEPRGHLARLHRIDAAVVLARDAEHRGTGDAGLYVVV